MSLASLRYAEAIANPLYAPDVEKQLNNPNQTIAEAARRPLSKLRTASRQ